MQGPFNTHIIFQMVTILPATALLRMGIFPSTVIDYIGRITEGCEQRKNQIEIRTDIFRMTRTFRTAVPFWGQTTWN